MDYFRHTKVNREREKVPFSINVKRWSVCRNVFLKKITGPVSDIFFFAASFFLTFDWTN